MSGKLVTEVISFFNNIVNLSLKASISIFLGVPLAFFIIIFLGISLEKISPEAIGWVVIPVVVGGTVMFSVAVINICCALKKWCEHKILENEERKRALMYLVDMTSMTNIEFSLLLKQKNKGTNIFQSSSSSLGPAESLAEKGILARRKYINAVKEEYEIPDFVWKSKELKMLISELCSKNQTSMDTISRFYDEWEQEQKESRYI